MKKAYKKKNRLVPLLAGVLSLALLGGIYAAVSSYNAKKQAEADAEAKAKDAKIMLAEYGKNAVSYMEYSFGGEVVRLEYKNDFWYNADDNFFPLNQTQPISMATALSSIAADRLIEDSTANFATYGLDEPYEYIAVKYNDNSGFKMVFGDLNSFTGTRYMNIDGTGKVYLVKTALLDYFKYTHNDLITHDTIPPVQLSALTELAVTNTDAAGATSTARYYKLAAAENGASGDSAADKFADTSADAAKKTVWMFDNGSGEPKATDEKTVSELLAGVTGLQLKNCAAYNIRDDETFRKYGLGSAAATTVTVKYTETAAVADESSAISSTAARTVDKQFAVAYSAPDADGKSYANVAGSKLVYLIGEKSS